MKSISHNLLLRRREELSFVFSSNDHVLWCKLLSLSIPLFIVPLKIQISSKQFWPLNDWFHCHKCFRWSKVKQFVLALPVQYLSEGEVKQKKMWSEFQSRYLLHLCVSGSVWTPVMFRVRRLALFFNLHFYPVWPQRSALSIHNTYILKSIEWQYFCKGQWFLFCLSWRQKYVLRCTQYSLYSKTSIEYCLVYGTFSPFYYISLTWSVIELVR